MIEAIAVSSGEVASLDKYFEVYSGEDKTLYIQVNIRDENSHKQPLDLTGATAIEIDIPTENGDLTLSLISTPPIVVDVPLFGRVHIDLTATQTNVMIDGVAPMRITKGGKVIIAVASTIKKMIIPGC